LNEQLELCKDVLHGLIALFVILASYEHFFEEMKRIDIANLEQLPACAFAADAPTRRLITAKHFVTTFIPAVCVRLDDPRIPVIAQLHAPLLIHGLKD
jgi:hypothetical protein